MDYSCASRLSEKLEHLWLCRLYGMAAFNIVDTNGEIDKAETKQ